MGLSCPLPARPAAAPASRRTSARPGKLSETRSTRDAGLPFLLPSAAPIRSPLFSRGCHGRCSWNPAPAARGGVPPSCPVPGAPRGCPCPSRMFSPRNSTSASEQNGGYSQLCQLLRPRILGVLLPAFWKRARIRGVPRGDLCGWTDFCLYAACFKSSAKLTLHFPLSSLYTEP